MRRGLVMVTLEIPDDYDGDPIGDALGAICEIVPAELRAGGFASFGDDVEKFLALKEASLNGDLS